MNQYNVFLHLQDGATGHRGDLDTAYFADSIDSLQQMILADYGEYLLHWQITSIQEAV